MKLGSLTISAAVVLAAMASVWLWGTCRYRAGAQEAILQQAGDTTDARLARLVADQLEQEAAWHRTEIVINARNVILRHRADSLAQVVATFATSGVPDSGTFVPKVVALAALAAKDSVITSERQRAAFYQGQVASYRDTVVPALQRLNVELTAQRDSWKGQAQQPSYAITDIGGAALAGYGVSEKNSTLALVGAVVVVAPRVLHGVGHLLGRIF